MQRYDHTTRQIRLVTSWPEHTGGAGAGEHKYRFAWTYPIVISPHDPNTLYIGGNMVFKSHDEGQSWQPISPDLTRADPETLKPTGGPINRDSVGAEVYATVYAFVESPLEKDLFWAGSDDGLLHLSRDGGANWQNITPKDLPEWTLISCIEPSPFDAATAYVAGTRYKLDDYQPYLYVTRDFGASWQRIDNGIPAHDFTRVIRTDPTRQGLLYAGTETGVYVSFDDGARWQRFQLNLPVTPIHELLVKNSDLIAGTHGRSIWILDDLTPLRELANDLPNGPAHLFPPRDTIRVLPGIDWSDPQVGNTNYFAGRGGGYLAIVTPDGEKVRTMRDVGDNPPAGAIITYRLEAVPEAPITLTFYKADGSEIRSFTSRKADDPTIAKERRVPAQPGWNRFVWDLRHGPVTKIEGSDLASETTLSGPIVAPGNYTVKLKVGETELSQPFKIIKPANVAATQADLDAQYDLLWRLHTLLDRTAKTINRMRALRGQLDGWAKRAADHTGGAEVVESAKALSAKVLEVEKTLQVPDLRPGWADNLNQGPRLFLKLSQLPPVVALGDYRPTDAAEAVFTELSQQIEAQLTKFDTLLKDDLAAFNALIIKTHLGAVLA